MPLVTIEGLDGSGKSTILKALTAEYPDAVITAEPTREDTGQLLRERLQQDDSPVMTDFFLFMADRATHIEEVIKPALEKDELVICARYADSTRAYQPVAMMDAGVFKSQFAAKNLIEQTMAPWLVEPDCTLYLDVSVDEAIRRTDGDEKYENERFLTNVRDNYEAMEFYYERMHRIDAEQNVDVVIDDAIETVSTHI